MIDSQDPYDERKFRHEFSYHGNQGDRPENPDRTSGQEARSPISPRGMSSLSSTAGTIESQRKSGYKNSACAAREIIDNALEAGARVSGSSSSGPSRRIAASTSVAM